MLEKLRIKLLTLDAEVMSVQNKSASCQKYCSNFEKLYLFAQELHFSGRS